MECVCFDADTNKKRLFLFTSKIQIANFVHKFAFSHINCDILDFTTRISTVVRNSSFYERMQLIFFHRYVLCKLVSLQFLNYCHPTKLHMEILAGQRIDTIKEKMSIS